MEYLPVWHDDGVIIDKVERSADPSHIFSSTAENALGLSGMFRPERVWPIDVLACDSARSRPNQHQTCDHFSHRTSTFDTPADSHQPFTPHHDLVCTKRASGGVILHSALGSRPIYHPIDRKTVDKSRTQTQRTADHLHYTPYPSRPDRHKSGTLPTWAAYRCQWSDDVIPCGMFVEGTKSAIGKHLRAAHAIGFKSDKSSQVCQWPNCLKLMRRESIPRHILAVHMENKVYCPGCGSGFARVDSLKRHQRTCLIKEEEGR